MDLEQFFRKQGIKSVAIYGMNEKGQHTYDEIKKIESIKEVFGIEKINYARRNNYKIYYLFEDEIPEVDAVLVIPYKELDFITWELDSFISESCQIISIQELAEQVCE